MTLDILECEFHTVKQLGVATFLNVYCLLQYFTILSPSMSMFKYICRIKGYFSTLLTHRPERLTSGVLSDVALWHGSTALDLKTVYNNNLKNDGNEISPRKFAIFSVERKVEYL